MFCFFISGFSFIVKDENIQELRKNSTVFLLTSSPKNIAQRIKDGTERPSLTGKSFIDEIEEVLNERKPRYEKAKHHEINTDDITLEQAAEQIIAIINKKR
jgi:shikimate kinase